MKNKGKILVSGSIVIDSLFDITSNIKDHINMKNGILGTQNFMFTATEKEEYWGGTGGNIAYGLAILGEKPILFSAVGKDFSPHFKNHLKEVGAELRVYEDEKRFTATFYALSDSEKQQIGIFQPGAYGKHIESIPLSKTLSPKDFSDIKIAIFSPGTAKSILSNMEEFKKRNSDAKIIFDPGQALMASFTKPILEKALSLSDILIANEVEMNQIKNKFGITFEHIFKLGIHSVIETLGENGSVLHTANKRTKISTVKAKKVLDPTGAGDAFRAGLIHGMMQDLSLDEAMKIGAKMGAECVAYQGGQTYSLPKSLK